MYVTVPEKTDHSVALSDIEIVVPSCSALFTVRNREVRKCICMEWSVFSDPVTYVA